MEIGDVYFDVNDHGSALEAQHIFVTHHADSPSLPLSFLQFAPFFLL